MTRTVRIALALTLALALPLPSGASAAVTDRPTPARLAGRLAPDTLPARWVLQAEESEARYRVREQLAGFDFPNDAVGSTRVMSGRLVLTADGGIAAEESFFRVDLTTLVTDNDRRDNYVRRRTLEVEQHPEAVFIPRRFENLPTPLPTSGRVEFDLEGDLNLHGVTRTVLWEVTAEMGPNLISGFATTAFPFERFEIAIPQVARVLSVNNSIRLELDFRMVPQGG